MLRHRLQEIVQHKFNPYSMDRPFRAFFEGGLTTVD